MDHANGTLDMTGRVALYRQYDEARQQELEKFAEQFEDMRHRLEVLEADLEDEKETRQGWRKRAQLAETAITRGQFILVLVDGDGYIFRDEYLREAGESGGAMAAHRLATDVQDYLRERNIIDPSSPDIQVMVNVYANRAGLTKHLFDADMIQHPTQLDQFFCSFTQSQALFQFIDCGYGKERADAKLRGRETPACSHSCSLNQIPIAFTRIMLNANTSSSPAVTITGMWPSSTSIDTMLSPHLRQF